MNIEQMKLADIIPYAGNAKKHDDRQIKNVMESIKQFGVVQPLVVDKDNVLIIGHCRLIASKRLKLKEVPVVRLEDLSEDEAQKLRLLDNKLNESEWDFDLLAEQIPELDFTNFDIDWGIDLDDDAQEGEIEEDEIPEVPEEPRAKVGDLYELGDHRLICGDSTDVDVIGRLMDGARADLLLTDPPYGIDVVQNKKVGFGEKGKNKITNCNEYAPIIGDETTDTARASYDISLIYSKNQIIFGGNYFTDFLSPSRCWIVWDKQNTGNFADAELAWTSFDKGVRLYHFLWNGLCREGNRKIEGKTRVHPTQKPAGMLSDILKDFSRENDGILDLFGGSGSTLIACEQLNRKCYMCELDPHYVDVIIARWEKLTGRKAVKL